MSTPSQAAFQAAINEINRTVAEEPHRPFGYYVQELLDTQREQDAKRIEELEDTIEQWKEASGLLCGGDPDGVKPYMLQADLQKRDEEVTELTKRVEELEASEKRIIEDWHTNRAALEESLHHFKQEFYKAEASVAEMFSILRRVKVWDFAWSSDLKDEVSKILGNSTTLGQGWKSPERLIDESIIGIHELGNSVPAPTSNPEARERHFERYVDPTQID
jgi:flagellar motility protein MotE (MotC chaperone)